MSQFSFCLCISPILALFLRVSPISFCLCISLNLALSLYMSLISFCRCISLNMALSMCAILLYLPGRVCRGDYSPASAALSLAFRDDSGLVSNVTYRAVDANSWAASVTMLAPGYLSSTYRNREFSVRTKNRCVLSKYLYEVCVGLDELILGAAIAALCLLWCPQITVFVCIFSWINIYFFRVHVHISMCKLYKSVVKLTTLEYFCDVFNDGIFNADVNLCDMFLKVLFSGTPPGDDVSSQNSVFLRSKRPQETFWEEKNRKSGRWSFFVFNI